MRRLAFTPNLNLTMSSHWRAWLSKLTGRSVWLLCGLQLVVWLSILQPKWDQLVRQEGRVMKLQQQVETQQQWLAGNVSPNWLNQYDWLAWQVSQPQTAVAGGIQLQLSLQGAASASDWRSLLLQLEESLALSPLSMDWQRLANQQWQADVRLQLRQPDGTQTHSLWSLPIANTELDHGALQLVGTLLLEEQRKGLFMLEDRQITAAQGDWLAAVAATVVAVHPQSVELVSATGKTFHLWLRGFGPPEVRP